MEVDDVTGSWATIRQYRDTLERTEKSAKSMRTNLLRPAAPCNNVRNPGKKNKPNGWASD
jgi:hypothetical protein